MRVLTTGPHGGLNLGDELVLYEIGRALSAQGHSVVAMSLNPQFTLRFAGLDSVPGIDLRSMKFGAADLFQRFDALVVAGGEQVQLGRWGNPLWGLLMNATYATRKAVAHKVPVFCWAIGGSEPLNWAGAWLVRHGIALSAGGTVRDASTLATLRHAGFRENRLRLAADPVFAAVGVEHVAAKAGLARRLGGTGDAPIVLICPANDLRVSLSYLASLGDLSARLSKELGAVCVLVLMDQQPRYDQQLEKSADLQGLVRLSHAPETAEELYEIFAAADLVVAARMHAVIASLVQGTPTINLERAKKMRSLSEDVQTPSFPLRGLNTEGLVQKSLELLSAGRTQWLESRFEMLQLMRERALTSARTFEESIGLGRPA